MIISHKYKFIFIKTSKTAGTSMEIALSRFCGDTDIITPLDSESESMRTQLGYRGPQNYLAPPIDYRLQDLKKLIKKGARKLRFWPHISASEIKQIIGVRVWNDYFKFCFERNPYERLISYYYRHNEKQPRPSISQELNSGILSKLKARGIDLYTINGEVVVDRVCLYENMEDELEKIRLMVGFPKPLELPQANVTSGKDRRKYHDILNRAQIEEVRKVFSQELSLFGYG